MTNPTTPIWLTAAVSVSTIIGTYLGITTQFVSKAQFDEFKTSTITYIGGRLDRIEAKVDALSANQH